MKSCSDCRKPNREQACFCGHCGKPLTARSPVRGWSFNPLFLWASLVIAVIVGVVVISIQEDLLQEHLRADRFSPDVLLERVRTEPIDVLSYMRDFERRTHVLVNEHRIAIGLEPLEYSEALAMIARQHSKAIATGYEFFSHDGFEERKRMAQGFVQLETFAENLALNNSSPASAPTDAVAGWLDSPGHRKNMEGQFNLTGIGCARGKDGVFYFTQLFGLR